MSFTRESSSLWDPASVNWDYFVAEERLSRGEKTEADTEVDQPVRILIPNALSASE